MPAPTALARNFYGRKGQQLSSGDDPYFRGRLGKVGCVGFAAALAASASFSAPGQLGATDVQGFVPTLAGQVNVGTLVQEQNQLEQICLHLPITGALDADATATVEYRLNQLSSWTQAHPLFRLNSSAPGGEAFTGAIFDLMPGQTYETRVTATSGIVTQIITGSFTTRALPAPAGTPNKTANASNAQSQLNGLVPGDVLQLDVDTYPSSLSATVHGTEAQPIYIVGENIDTTILEARFSLDADWVIVENLSLVRPTPNFGAGSEAARIGFDGGGQTTNGNNSAMRNIIIRNFSRGIKTAGGTAGPTHENFSIINVDMQGLITWAQVTDGSLWSEDGIRLVGQGHAVVGCTISGYADAVTFAHSASNDIRSCFAYRCFINISSDDCFEFDHHGRNCGAYDNYCQNLKTTWSISDETNYGPTWIVRNVFLNFLIGPKTNDTSRGAHVYQNTMLKADGIPGEGTSRLGNGYGRGIFDASPSGGMRDFALRGNLIIYRGAADPNSGVRELLRLRYPSAPPCDMSHNGYHPANIQIQLEGEETFSDLAGAEAQVNPTSPLYPSPAGLGAPTSRFANTVAVEADPFQTPITMGTDGTTEITGMPSVALRSDSVAKNAGVAIPGITDGYSGAAPDLGASIAGRTAVVYGFVHPSAKPDWVAALTNNTWTEQTAQTSRIGDVVLSDQGQYGNTSPANQHIHGHASSALVTTLGAFGSMVYWSGGHADYFGPEIYQFDLNDLLWSVLDATLPANAAAAMAAGLDPTGVHLNGQPGVPHNWHTFGYNVSTNEIFSLIRERNNQGGNFYLRMTRFNVVSKTWVNETENLFTAASGGIGQKLGMGPDSSGHVWWMADLGTNPYQLVAYDFSDNSITRYNTPVAPGIGVEDPENSYLHPTTGAFLVFTNQDNFVGIDINSPTTAAVGLSISGGVPSWLYEQGSSFNWSSNLNRLVVYRSRSDEVYFLDPPAGDWKTNAWTLTQLATTGTTGVHSGDSDGSGRTYGKFRLLEAGGETIGVINNNPSTPVKVLRMAA